MYSNWVLQGFSSILLLQLSLSVFILKTVKSICLTAIVEFRLALQNKNREDICWRL